MDLSTSGSEPPFRSISFLLRIWQVQSDGDWIWLFSLEDPLTGERFGFKDLKFLSGKLENICKKNDRSCESGF